MRPANASISHVQSQILTTGSPWWTTGSIRKKGTCRFSWKYVSLHDAYISVVESLKHAGVAHRADVEIKWVDSELVTKENVAEILGDVSGILVPGGFGDRGIEGMIEAITYARENKIPYLGLCLGMQLTIVEFVRNVVGYPDANSSEFNPSSSHQVIHIMPDQNGVTDLGGTLRLGSYPCVLDKSSKHTSYMVRTTSTNVTDIVMR